jgi:hypothetical protein
VPTDFPELAKAFDAWGQRDFPRMVAECLTACGVRMTKPEQVERGLGWLFFSGSSVVFVVLDAERVLSIESPVVLVPPAQRTPLFRSLLELNERALGSARFCLRVDRVVLKYSDRVENVAPPKLMAVLREVALAADHFDNLLSHRFLAPMVGPELKRPSAQPWQMLGAPLRLSVAGDAAQALPSAPRPGRTDLAEEVGERSEGSFSFHPDGDPGEGEELELARDPYAGRRNPALPLLARLRDTLERADHLATTDGGLLSLMLVRSAALWGRAVLPAEAQGLATFLLVTLGEHVDRLPEPGYRVGPRTPAFSAVRAAVARALEDEGAVDPAFEQGAFRLRPFKAPDEPRTHVRKFMTLMTRCPKDEAARGLLLEGALCELLMRAPPLPKEHHDRVVRATLEPAPPSAMRVHELQNVLTRSWP